MSTVQIRPYEPGDAEAVRRCIVELQAHERTLEADRAEATASFAEDILQRKLTACRERRGAVLVAEAEGAVAGFVCCWIATITNPITTLTECAYVAALSVLGAYRRRGLGRALLRAAEDYALRQDVAMIRLDVLAANVPARELYDAEGYRPFEMSLTKRLVRDHH